MTPYACRPARLLLLLQGLQCPVPLAGHPGSAHALHREVHSQDRGDAANEDGHVAPVHWSLADAQRCVQALHQTPAAHSKIRHNNTTPARSSHTCSTQPRLCRLSLGTVASSSTHHVQCISLDLLYGGDHVELLRGGQANLHHVCDNLSASIWVYACIQLFFPLACRESPSASAW